MQVRMRFVWIYEEKYVTLQQIIETEAYQQAESSLNRK